MAKSYEEKAKEAIQDCYWRKNIHGVFVCAADLSNSWQNTPTSKRSESGG